ncbi:MAG: type II toxin-antitoxin system Phd/YefM family antitoxin [Spirochaetaceae bacterium]
MKVANISTTKNELSRILGEVKAGETYLIVDRNVPIARVEPLQAPDSRLSALATDGAVVLPERELDVEDFLAAGRPRTRGKASAVAVLLAERESGR